MNNVRSYKRQCVIIISSYISTVLVMFNYGYYCTTYMQNKWCIPLIFMFAASVHVGATTGMLVDNSHYLSGDNADYLITQQFGNSGNLFILTKTNSSNFPLTTGSVNNIGYTYVITKLSVTYEILYSVALVGEYTQLVLDSQENEILGGQIVHNGTTDVRVTKIMNTGILGWTVDLTGNETDSFAQLAINQLDDVYVAGTTNSSDFSVLNNDQSYGGGMDAFVTSISSTGDIQWSTYLGGSGDDQGLQLAISSDSVFIGGITLAGNFPVTRSDIPQKFGYDMFFASYDFTGSKLMAFTIGGGSNEILYSMKVDSTYIYAVGTTEGVSGFPAIGGNEAAYTPGDIGPVVVVATLAGLIKFSQIISNDRKAYPRGITLASNGGFFVWGETNARDYFSSLNSGAQGGYDCFVTRFTGSFSKTYDQLFGGNKDDFCVSMLEESDGLYLTLETGSDPLPGFTYTSGHNVNDNNRDMVVMKVIDGQIDYFTYFGAVGDDIANSLISQGDHYTLTGTMDIRGDDGIDVGNRGVVIMNIHEGQITSTTTTTGPVISTNSSLNSSPNSKTSSSPFIIPIWVMFVFSLRYYKSKRS